MGSEAAGGSRSGALAGGAWREFLVRGSAAAGVPAAALSATLAAAALALWLGGYDPAAAAIALFRGALGSREAFLSITLVRATPLILTGLAVAVAFRAGVWNIGAEGQLYAGAVAGVWVGLRAGGLAPWLAVTSVLAASAVAGALWSAIPAVMKLKMDVGEVITTLLMNFVAIDLAAYAVRGPLQEARGVFPQTEAIADSARLGILVPGTRLHAGLLVGLVLAVAAWAFLRWAAGGFAVRAVGASPEAAAVSGRIRVALVAAGTFLVSGGLAGLAGGVEVSGVTYALYEGLSPGWGYTAIAVALLGRLNPLGVVLAGVFFGALEGGSAAMQRAAGIPSAWVGVVEALAVLCALAAERFRG